jgi:hypothetical protein
MYSNLEFISETLTDDSYFSVVPAILSRLLDMQSDHSFLVRAKALSVYRACIEQMEMYKDIKAHRTDIFSYVDSALGPWVLAINQNLSAGENGVSEDTVKLANACRKVVPFKFSNLAVG